jgi:hypothetical protein
MAAAVVIAQNCSNVEGRESDTAAIAVAVAGKACRKRQLLWQQ